MSEFMDPVGQIKDDRTAGPITGMSGEGTVTVTFEMKERTP